MHLLPPLFHHLLMKLRVDDSHFIITVTPARVDNCNIFHHFSYCAKDNKKQME